MGSIMYDLVNIGKIHVQYKILQIKKFSLKFHVIFIIDSRNILGTHSNKKID